MGNAENDKSSSLFDSQNSSIHCKSTFTGCDETYLDYFGKRGNSDKVLGENHLGKVTSVLVSFVDDVGEETFSGDLKWCSTIISILIMTRKEENQNSLHVGEPRIELHHRNCSRSRKCINFSASFSGQTKWNFLLTLHVHQHFELRAWRERFPMIQIQ